MIIFFYNFRYQTLATTVDDKESERNDQISTGKRLVADWVLGLGEPACQLDVIQGKSEEEISSKIIVLGIRTIFVLHHTGVLIFSKKLDFSPVTMLSYPSGKL